MEQRIKKRQLTPEELLNKNKELMEENKRLAPYEALNINHVKEIEKLNKEIRYLTNMYKVPRENMSAEMKAIEKKIKQNSNKNIKLQKVVDEANKIAITKNQRGDPIWKMMFGDKGKFGKECKHCKRSISHKKHIWRVLQHVKNCTNMHPSIKIEYANEALKKTRSAKTIIVANKIKNEAIN